MRTTVRTTTILLALCLGPVLPAAASAAATAPASRAVPTSSAVTSAVTRPAERVLVQGMRGPDVRRWQLTVNAAIRLGQLRHPRIAQDGVFGQRTRSATVALQKRVKVRADGRVTPATRTAVSWLLEGLPE